MLDQIFGFLAKAFDTIPMMSKIKGYRSAIGLVGLTALYILDAAHVHGGTSVATYGVYFTTFTGLALNAKGRE